jgi:hypothetical protein
MKWKSSLAWFVIFMLIAASASLYIFDIPHDKQVVREDIDLKKLTS